MIYGFGGAPDGCGSRAILTAGPGGVLYGTTLEGGTGSCNYNGIPGCGTVFQLTPPVAVGDAWTETIVHSFTGENGDGAIPWSAPTLASRGVLYGTTGNGGAFGFGTVFEIKP